MQLDGTVQANDEGVVCNECDEVIGVNEQCIRVDHAKVTREGYGAARAAPVNFGGVYHTECI